MTIAERLMADLARHNAEMADLLVACSDFLDAYVDVKDGYFGKPVPNRAMTLQMEIKALLGKGGY